MKKDVFYEKIHRATGDEPYIDIHRKSLQYPAHWHEEIELLWVTSGAVHICIDGKNAQMMAGDVAVVMAGEIHSYQSHEENQVVVMKFQLPRDKSFAELNTLCLNQSIYRKADEPAIYQQLLTLIAQIAREYDEKKEGYGFAIKASFYAILLTIVRNLPWQAVTSERKKKVQRQRAMVESVVQYVEVHYLEPIALDEIAKATGFSKYYFAHFFKEATGTNFGDFLSQYRLEKAKQDLSMGDVTVTEVAHGCGFPNIKTFNRIFKKLTGLSPTQYRKMTPQEKSNN